MKLIIKTYRTCQTILSSARTTKMLTIDDSTPEQFVQPNVSPSLNRFSSSEFDEKSISSQTNGKIDTTESPSDLFIEVVASLKQLQQCYDRVRQSQQQQICRNQFCDVSSDSPHVLCSVTAGDIYIIILDEWR